MNNEQKRAIRDLVVKHIVPKVIAKDKGDEEKAQKLQLLMAYELGLDQVVSEWTADLEALFASIEHTAEIRGMQRLLEALTQAEQGSSQTGISWSALRQKAQQLIEEVV